ncbi:hypothetical protein [Streptomyces sp. NRRL S-350]|uniref:hypothetical protein n=1 Tax=Streptomyces sp. NRRL S-350 TaxID=1463902 RepID=UPI0006902341|nr:hypothetical protein [Streptomyces sp. NRRL S-350]
MNPNADGTSTDVTDDRDLWVGLGLAEAAAGATVGAAPVSDILAGGRRLRRRRRTVVGALALASVVTLAGAAMAQLHPEPGAGRLSPAGTGPVVAPAGVPTAGSAAPATAGVRDPLVPVRVRIGQGVVGGDTWELWQALWPAAPKERAYEQALAVWQERAPYDPSDTKPTEGYVRQYYDPDSDVTDTYFTVNGVRLGHDLQGTTASPGKLDPRDATSFSGGLMGHWGKGDTVAPLDVVHLSIGPDVGRVLVTWTDGTTTEPRAVTVGDSPTRHMVVARPGALRATSWQFFDKDGNKLPDAGARFLFEPASS